MAPKASTTKKKIKVTFMMPAYLIELADMHAEKTGLDRYDVIRMAVGEGLMNMRINQEIRDNPQAYAKELLALTSNEPGAYSRLSDKVAENVVESIRRQKDERDAA